MPDIGKAVQQPGNDNHQPQETNIQRPMTGEREWAHQTSPRAPVPTWVNVRVVAQALNVALRKISQKNVLDLPKLQGFLYSNARHILGREANPESLFFLTSSTKFSVKTHRLFSRP
jgi:hypothetical protein